VTEPVLDVDQAASLLRCAPETVRERAVELGGIKFGRDWVFPAEAFIEALNEQARASRQKAKPASSPDAVLTAPAPPRRVPPKLPA
jgi:CO/xanthine dehydrogenase Mo-binding subunit